MREETKRKLDRLQQYERNTLIYGVAGLTLLAGTYFAFRHVTISDRLLAGEVRRAVWRIHEKTGMRYPEIDVLLDGGRAVITDTLEPSLPKTGSRVIVREKRKITGYHAYSWEGAYDTAEKN